LRKKEAKLFSPREGKLFLPRGENSILEREGGKEAEGLAISMNKKRPILGASREKGSSGRYQS